VSDKSTEQSDAIQTQIRSDRDHALVNSLRANSGDELSEKPFGPSGPSGKDLLSHSIDLQRQTMSRSDLISLLSVASKDHDHASTAFDWSNGSQDELAGDPSQPLGDFHQMEAIREIRGLYHYPDQSQLDVTINKDQQSVRCSAHAHNSLAERRMYEMRTLASEWKGSRIVTRSKGRRVLQDGALNLALVLLSGAAYFFALSLGLPKVSDGAVGTSIAFLWALATGAVGGAVTSRLDSRRNRDRKFVMRHPKRRKLNHDEIQSWGTVVSVVVAVILGVLGLALRP
jgi:hypothetical protein